MLGLAGRGSGELVDVRLGQVGAEQDESRQMQLSALDAFEQARIALHEARGGDPTERGANGAL